MLDLEVDQSVGTEETKAILVEGEDQEFINREENFYHHQHIRMVVVMILNCSTQTCL